MPTYGPNEAKRIAKALNVPVAIEGEAEPKFVE
jgi:hypothetical protein